MDETTKLVEVEITISEGGTWLKLQVPVETLCSWLTNHYACPLLDGCVSIYAIKLIVSDMQIIRDFGATTWRTE